MSKVLLGEVSHERKETCKGSKEGYPIVGLEHLIPEEITLTTWDEGAENTFTKMFRKGDVLFGRRRAYLKKAAVAPFDGICSGDITVIEADPDKILPELLPFIIQNDDLFDFAVGKSAGSLSPRVKWEHLKNYELELPDMDKQKELAELLWAIDDTKKSYQKLIAATDELVKSQFIEMFGYKNDDMKTIDDVANICRGASPRPIAKYVTDDENGINWIKIGDVAEEDIYITHTAEKITEDGAKKSRAVEPGDFILSNSMSFGRPYIVGIQGCVHDGWLIISDYQDYLDPLFFYYELRSDLVQRQFDGSANGSCVKNLNSDLVKKVKIHIPSMDKQKEFIEFAEQSDKSQFIEMFGEQKENPKGLPMMTLGETCKFFSGTGFPNKYQGNVHGTYPFYKVGDISRNVQEGNVRLRAADNYIEPDIVKAIKGTIIPPNTVVFAKIGEALRLNRRAVTTQNCLIDNNAMGIQPITSVICLEYFLQFMIGLDMNEYSTATALPSVRKSSLEMVKIIVPDVANQQQFSDLAIQSDKSKLLLQNKYEKINQDRRLLTCLMKTTRLSR